MKQKTETKLLIRVLVLAFITFLGVSAATAKKHPSFLRIPIFFITDRNLVQGRTNSNTNNIAFGPHRKYIGDCKHEPYLGTA